MEDKSYKNMLSQHVENIFKKYTEAGLHVCDLATGGGKSHAIAKLTCQYYPEHFKRIVILCVQTKLVDGMVNEINNQLDLGRSSIPNNNIITQKDILIIKSNKDVIIEAVTNGKLKELVAEMEQRVKDVEGTEYSHGLKLRGTLENIQQLVDAICFVATLVDKRKNDATDVYTKDLEEKERNLRNEIRRYFNIYKRCVEHENSMKLTDASLFRVFPSLNQVYPQSEISKKRVLIMTIHKSLHGIDPIIKDKLKLEDLVASGDGSRTLFILDESDQAAIDMRNAIIQQQTNSPYGQDKYAKGYQGYLTYNKLVDDRDNINNEQQAVLLKENLSKAANRLEENWQREFGLKRGFNDILIGNNTELEKFKRAVFFAGPTISLSIAPRGNKTETYICYKDGDKHFCLVHRKNEEIAKLKREYSVVMSLEHFLTFNIKNINVIMAQLADVARKSFEFRKNEFMAELTRVGNNTESTDSYLSFPSIDGEAYSLFARFANERSTQLQKNQLMEYMTNRKNIIAMNKHNDIIKVPDDSVYVQGVQLFEEDVDENDTQKHIRISCREIKTTPEKILYNLVSRGNVSVVLCSATASSKSVINNCDIQYLRGRLGSNMHFLSQEDIIKFDKLVELTYPQEHKVQVNKIKTFSFTDSRPTSRKMPKDYFDMFSKSAKEDGSAEDWFYDLISGNVADYEVSRWLQFVEVYHWFITNNETRTMLFFQNRTGKKESAAFHKVASLIDGTYKQDFRDEKGNKICPYLKITNKSEELEEHILPDLANGKIKKVMLICAYGSFKAGVNMQYGIPEGLSSCINGDNWDKDPKQWKKDWDAIYVQAPTNYMSIDMSRDNTYETGLYKVMLNLMMLQARSCLSLTEIEVLLSKALSRESFMFSTETYHGAANDKAAWALTIIEQAIGRLCRTRNKPSTTYIMYDEAISQYFKTLDRNKSQTKEFRALVKAIVSDNQNEEDYPIDELIRYNKVCNARRNLDKTRRLALRYTIKPSQEELHLPTPENVPYEVTSRL